MKDQEEGNENGEASLEVVEDKEENDFMEEASEVENMIPETKACDAMEIDSEDEPMDEQTEVKAEAEKKDDIKLLYGYASQLKGQS